MADEEEGNLIEVRMDAHEEDETSVSEEEDLEEMSGDDLVSEDEDEAGAEAERGATTGDEGMPRHVQRALWRILVGDPASLGPEPTTHDELIQSLKRARVLLDQRVSRAMELIPRGSFVPEEQRGEAYLDCPLAVPQLGFNISAPHIHATCLEKLCLEPGHRFLDVGSGTVSASALRPPPHHPRFLFFPFCSQDSFPLSSLGCGLVTCLGAYIVGKTGSVVGIEINDDALAIAEKNLASIKADCPEFALTACEVTFEKHNVFLPDPKGRLYDRINVAGTCPRSRVPSLLNLLREDGKLIVPCGSELQLYNKEGGGKMRMEVVSNVRFGTLVVPTDAEVVIRTLELDKKREIDLLRRVDTSSSQESDGGMDEDHCFEEEEQHAAAPSDNHYDCLIIGKRIPHGIPCHKHLLAGTCKLFKAQFTSPMKDARANELEIPENFSFQACQLFVDFLYGKGVFLGLGDSHEETSRFLETKQELQDVPTRTIIDTLQLGTYVNCAKLCRFQEAWLETLISVENCVELLTVADEVGCAPCLQRECLDFIVEEYDEVVTKTSNFEGLEPHLVKQIAGRACKKLSKVMNVLRDRNPVLENEGST